MFNIVHTLRVSSKFIQCTQSVHAPDVHHYNMKEERRALHIDCRYVTHRDANAGNNFFIRYH